ncbi:pilus assembly protein TadG-related protein [Nocardioides silvaticus]|uniref:pilus assembly protein TadG-related protein n=1 Tax=Nocardioides silvaticus TaxID=2201891 RepID=UPI001304E898|nr:pilus assembly protein TadG-related protein [Nocardioides silvaticus]
MLTACLLPIVVGVAAIVVDIGMQRVTRTDLQALADVVALDLAREITGGRTQAQLAAEGDLSDPGSAVSQSVARNPDVVGIDLEIDVDWGAWDGEHWDTAVDPPTAVRVTAHADTDYAIASGTGEATRRAYAVASSSACYRLGTFVTAVKTGDSSVLGPLNHLFGVNLTLVGYRALADARVNLADLAATSAIGSPTALLTGTVSYTSLLNAVIEVLSNQTGASAAISALRAIVAVSAPVGSIALGDVLHVSPDDTAALGIDLNVLDIVGSARLANGQHFIEVPNIQAQVPGVGFQFVGSIALISAAQLACGQPNSAQSVARNAQLQGDLAITFANLPSLSVPGLATLQTSRATGNFHVSLADGQGQLISPPEVHCGDGTSADPHGMSVAVRTQPASLMLSTELEVGGEIRVSILEDLGLRGLLSGLLGILLPNKVDVSVKVRLDVGSNHPGGTSVADLRVPPNDVTPFETGSTPYLDPRYIVPTVTEVKIGGKSAALGAATALTNAIVNEIVGLEKGFAQKTLLPLIDNFNNNLIGPLARMVGLRFGGADVYAVGAVCGQPALRG